jgi:predicted PurR-regulated permease PerM
MSQDRFRKGFLLLLVVAISAGFLWLVRGFVLTILLAAIFAGLGHPIYRRLLGLVRGRAPLASSLTVLLGLVLVVGPLLTVAGVVVAEAVRVSENVRPRIEELLKQPVVLGEYFERLPGYSHVAPYREEILVKAGEVVGGLGGFLVQSLSDTTRGTVTFFFHFFLLLYTMFFLLMDGKAMLSRTLTYLPLREAEKELMLGKFVSVTRATVKGTLLIGLAQGVLAGLAFWVVGIDGAVFWGTVMVVLSVIPAVGAALVWVPAAIILAVTGSFGKAVGLALFCGLVVGSVDNVLRPKLVGRDTQMHDLMILFSTLGGLIALGPIGFIVGPILAALFVTIWEIFGIAYRDQLASPEPTIADTDSSAE